MEETLTEVVSTIDYNGKLDIIINQLGQILASQLFIIGVSCAIIVCLVLWALLKRF